eukprot:m.209126 g.209126  ORF g.209126 m.209126 type:complete len:72 (-) comp18968_c1_seq18:3488-3703(-)
MGWYRFSACDTPAGQDAHETSKLMPIAGYIIQYEDCSDGTLSPNPIILRALVVRRCDYMKDLSGREIECLG